MISKATSVEHGEILAKLGAEVVYPERDTALRLAHRLETSKILDFVQLSEQLNISKLLIPEKMIGKTVVSLNLRSRFGINIIAIENDRVLLESVAPDYVFRNGDIMYISSGKSGLSQFTEWAEN